MTKLFADLYDETGLLTNLVDGKPFLTPDQAQAEVLQLYRESAQYRPNDYLFFSGENISLGKGRFRLNLGPDRYIVYRLQ